MMTATQLVMVLSTISPTDLPSVTRAKALYKAFRVERGFAAASPQLLTEPSANAKMDKSIQPSYGLSLSPWRLSGVLNACMKATRGCRSLCLNTAGKGRYNSVQEGRKVKTQFLVAHPEAFLALLVHELRRAVKRHDVPIAMRLNVLSDIQWETATPWLFEMFRDVTFYDYTKHLDRGRAPMPNYHLTMSASEMMTNLDIANLLGMGNNVTVVADKLDKVVPTHFMGHPVIDGDLTDFRPSDPKGVVVFLKPKGKAQKAPRGGFVRTADGFEVRA